VCTFRAWILISFLSFQWILEENCRTL
jgi:hypothetical protein